MTGCLVGNSSAAIQAILWRYGNQKQVTQDSKGKSLIDDRSLETAERLNF